jgi:hypothetical protein
LSGNARLTGKMPTWLGLLVALTTLFSGTNAFSGSIATQLGLLTRLEQL